MRYLYSFHVFFVLHESELDSKRVLRRGIKFPSLIFFVGL